MFRAPDSFWFLVPVTGFFAPLALLAYFGFRVYCIVTAERNTQYQLGLAWFFVVIEVFQLIPTVLLYFTHALVPKRPRRPHLSLEGEDVPGVDVMITACGEEHDLIMNVVRAACETDWPNDRLHVILLDDGKSEELQKSMQRLQKTYPWAYYTSRTPPEVPDYKAGNLNHGLEYSAGLSIEPFPFVAGLDVDMIVQPHWLRAMMPHLLNDPRLGMACPRQHFYNIPKNDRIRQDLDYFYNITELVHDGLGAGDCVGSGYLVRREAMDNIGGFPTYSISEDTGCSSALVGRGWGVAYVDEFLQCGEMPDTLIGHVKQRTRWTIGNVQTAIKLNYRLWGPLVPDCTLRQRLAGFVFGALSTVNSTLIFFGFVGLPLALLSGYPFVVYYNAWQLSWLLRLVSIWVFLDWMHKASFALFIGYRDGLRWDQADAWLAPYFILSFVRGFILPTRLGGRKPGFVASGSVTVPITERRPNQSPLWRRIRVIFFDRLVWVHALFISACVLGVILNLVRCFAPSAHVRSAYGDVVVQPGRQRWEYLLTRIGWPPIFWLAQVTSCWIPIAYTIWPPHAVTADEALVLDEKTKVKYPKPECWDPKRGWFPGRISDHFSTAMFLYTVVAFAGSWFVADVP